MSYVNPNCPCAAGGWKMPDLKPAVSVIVPYYHGSAYVDRIIQMIDSNAKVMQEERDESVELIIVNDSPEEELSIEDQERYPVKLLINPENSGIHASRVKGLKEAKGEYILFLDQDDVITDNSIFSQRQSIDGADFVIGNGYEELPDGSRRLIFATAEKQQCAADLNCHLYYNNLIRSPGQILIRKSAIPVYWTDHIMKNNGSDDALLWILMLSGGRAGVINRSAVYEHLHTGSNTSGDGQGMLRSKKEAAQLLEGIVPKAGIWAIQRRAEYYSREGHARFISYADVGLLRKLYAVRHFSRG